MSVLNSGVGLDRLLDSNWYPSEMFCRLADAIFFYLDANADSPNKNSGWIEPEKNMWWSSTMGTTSTSRDQVRTSSCLNGKSGKIFIPFIPLRYQNHYVEKYATSSLYSCLGIPFQTTQVWDQLIRSKDISS